MYSASSPYHNTQIVNNQFLDIMTSRTLITDQSDVHWTITPGYHLRPDLLAYDLYSDPSLWWVFAQRNPNVLADPFFDFVEGTSIFIPQFELLNAALGI